MRVLMISSTFPYPPSRGGTEIRTFNLLKHLSHNHEVTLITQRQTDVLDAEVDALKTWVKELVTFPLPDQGQSQAGLASLRGKVGRLVSSTAQGIPANVLHRYSPQIQTWIDTHIRDKKFDVVTCEHGVNAIYIRPEFPKVVRTVLNAHSLAYSSVRSRLETGTSDYRWRDRLSLLSLYRYEKRFCNQFSCMVATTEDDRQQLLEFCPNAQVEVVPNGVDLDVFPCRSADPGGHQLAFVGAMDGSHNIDAVRFFVLEVMPQLRQRYPDVTFCIVGSRPAPEVKALESHPGVTVTGRVESVADYLHQSAVCVLPLRTGFGIKNKTLEAMAAGIPVVGSDRSLEGLAVDGANTPLRALRANQVEDYINAISRLFENPDLRYQLSKEGRDLVENTYTWERAGYAYERVLQSM